MAHHWNFGFDQAGDQFEAAFPAFNFHGFGAAFFDQADSVAHRFFDRNVKTSIGHVGDQQGSPGAPAGGAGVMEDFFEGDRKSAVVAENYHADRIAHEQNIHPSLIEQARGGKIVRGQASDFRFRL